MGELTSRLITYLSREESVKSLLHWVTYGLDDLDEQAVRAEEQAYSKAVADKDVFPPFKADPNAPPASAVPEDKDESAAEDDGSPLAPGMGIGLGEGFASIEENNPDANHAKWVFFPPSC